MKRFAQLSLAVFVVSFSFLFPAVAAHAETSTNVTGYWDARLPSPNGDGTFRDVYFHIEQQGDSISGELIRHPAGIPIKGTVEGNTIHFVTVPPPPPPAAPGRPARPAQRPVTYDGTVDNGPPDLEPAGPYGLAAMGRGDGK